MRLLLSHLERPYRTHIVSLFEGTGRQAEFLNKNLTGGVPVLELEDGRVLPESNAILQFLAEGYPLSTERCLAAGPGVAMDVLRGGFHSKRIASLRHWTMTGKLARRSEEMIATKRAVSLKTLGLLERWLEEHDFLTDACYTIADMSVFAYISRADEAGIALREFPAVFAWVSRVREQAGFLDTVHPYSIDPYSARELP